MKSSYIIEYINTVTYEFQIIAMGKCCITGLLLGGISLIYCLLELVVNVTIDKHIVD